ncbi:MAG: hypothetical protein WD738_13085 [Pirellulales bacterium]
MPNYTRTQFGAPQAVAHQPEKRFSSNESRCLELIAQRHIRVPTMPSQEITIRVDPNATSAYLAASEEDRRKLDLLLSLRLQDVTQIDESLEEVMREIGRRAQERGLTPEILESTNHCEKY